MKAAAIAFAALVGGVALAPLAFAGTPPHDGWWTTANPGGVPVGLGSAGVPAGDLLVQGGPSDSNPVAVAAFARDVPPDLSSAVLTLHLDASAVNSTGALEACQLKSSDFVPSQGGPMSDAPAYDCTTGVFAAVGADGATYSFDVTRLAANGRMAVAVLAPSATTRVAIAPPGDAAVATTSPQSQAAPSTGSAAFDTGSSFASSVPLEPPGPANVAASQPSGTASAVPPTAPGQSFGPPVLASSTSDGEPTNPAAVALALLAVGGGTIAWIAAGKRAAVGGRRR